MAHSLFFFFFFFFFFFLTISIPSSLCNYTIFDVHASSIRAQNALSRNPLRIQTQSHQFHILTSNSSLSLPLTPRLALFKASYKDYESLVRARLARDAVRVQSINRNLDGITTRPESITLPVVSGQSQGSGEYFARIGVGQPVREFYLVPDTGSDVTWLQCQPCSNGNACFKQTDPIFDPKSSSSYNPLSCDSPQCKSLDSPGCDSGAGTGTCVYQVKYGDGSFTTGDFATETLSFGSSGSVANLPIGCGHDNEGLFVGAAGLIGLGGGALSLSSQLKASSFSYCLVDRDSDSSSTLEFNTARPGDSLTSPLLKNARFNTYRYVKVTGMSVGGKPLPISPTRFEIDGAGVGGIIVDSGTFITRLPSDVYESLRAAFVELTGNLPPARGVSPFDTCYDLSGQANVQVPTVAFELSKGNLLRLPGNNYLIRLDSAGTFCLAFLKTTSSLSIIGSFQQQGIRVSYDLVNSLVGFSSNKC